MSKSHDKINEKMGSDYMELPVNPSLLDPMTILWGKDHAPEKKSHFMPK